MANEGWYPNPNPNDPATERYWDGLTWTDHVRPTPWPPAAQNINVTVQAKRRRRLGFWGWVGVLLVLGASLEHWYYAVITAAVVIAGLLVWMQQRKGGR